MNKKHDYPRSPPRLAQLLVNDPLYFLTLCTYRRLPVLARPPVHKAFRNYCHIALQEHAVAVGGYVIMPDHLHLFVRGQHDFRLATWARLLKQALRKSFPRMEHPLWQRGFFDHVLRNDESYSQKWQYVRANPVRAGLVTDPDAWSYAGEFVHIDRA